MNKGKTKIWHLPFNTGLPVYRSQSWPCWDQSLKSLSKLCAVFASWTPPALMELWPWSWVVLGSGRLLALAEWMWTCSAALFFCLKTWWLAGIAGAGLPHGAFLSTSVEFQFWHINYSIMAAEFLMWIGSFFPLLFVIQHLQVTDRDAARALWCLKHSNILMYLIINRTDIHFSRDKDILTLFFFK